MLNGIKCALHKLLNPGLCSTYLVCEVAADLAVVGDVEPVQLVQPVGDGLACQESTLSVTMA